MGDSDIKKLEGRLREVIREEFRGVLGVGVLRGGQIQAYMGVSRKLPIRRWFERYGFPVNKDFRGRWWTTVSLIERWMMVRHRMMKKAGELGIKVSSGRALHIGKVTSYMNIERFSDEQRGRIMAAILEDDAKEVM